MKEQFKVVQWNDKWHIQLNGEPVLTKNGNILCFKERVLLDRLFLESRMLNSYLFEVISKVLDKNIKAFNDLVSNANYLAISSLGNSEIDLNMPSYADYIRHKGLVFIAESNPKKYFHSVLARQFEELSLERKVILMELVDQGFDCCLSLAFLEDQSTLSDLLENQTYIQKIRFEQNDTYFTEHLGNKFKTLIEILALI